ncbi:MAG TPA: lytic transglycosylase domain-containing protein [Rhizomicrobium sp.]|jgi:soluble lytic murein transglycosylase-like protein
MNRLQYWWPVAALLAAIATALLIFPVPPHPQTVVKHLAAVQRIRMAKIAPVKRVELPPVAKPVEKKAAPQTSAFATEQMMSPHQLLQRWDPDIAKAAKRFAVPQPWIRAVMQIESGGRTMLDENTRMTSDKGAMGLMQLMPDTYNDMRVQYRLGSDPYDPHDNIVAGAAYLRILKDKYGYPTMFAAYNDGPGNLAARMISGGLLPEETRNYLSTITGRLEGRTSAGGKGNAIQFTKPDGSPVAVDVTLVTAVRAALPNEYAPGVQTVIKIGRINQGVREDIANVRTAIRGHGGAI